MTLTLTAMARHDGNSAFGRLLQLRRPDARKTLGRCTHTFKSGGTRCRRKKRPVHAPDGGAKTSSHPLRLLLMRQQLCKSMSRKRLGPHSHPLDSWYFMGTWRGCQLPLPPTPSSANSLLRQLSLPPTPFSTNSPA